VAPGGCRADPVSAVRRTRVGRRPATVGASLDDAPRRAGVPRPEPEAGPAVPPCGGNGRPGRRRGRRHRRTDGHRGVRAALRWSPGGAVRPVSARMRGPAVVAPARGWSDPRRSGCRTSRGRPRRADRRAEPGRVSTPARSSGRGAAAGGSGGSRAERRGVRPAPRPSTCRTVHRSALAARRGPHRGTPCPARRGRPHRARHRRAVGARRRSPCRRHRAARTARW